MEEKTPKDSFQKKTPACPLSAGPVLSCLGKIGSKMLNQRDISPPKPATARMWPFSHSALDKANKSSEPCEQPN